MQDKHYKIITGADGREKIVTDDNVAIDKQIFEELWSSCDTYIELPRMIKQAIKDVIESESTNKQIDEDSILYHLDGIRTLLYVCKDMLQELLNAGRELGISDSLLNPDEIQEFEIHLDNMKDDLSFRRRF